MGERLFLRLDDDPPAGAGIGRAGRHAALGAGAELLERMAKASDDAARVALLQATLRLRLADAEGTAQATAERAAQLITASSGRRALRDVAAAVGVGERRLQQLFHAHVGAVVRWSLAPAAGSCGRAMSGCTEAP